MFSLTSPVKSPYHNVPPGPKFFLLMIASITLFLIGNIYLQAAALAFVLGLYLLPGGTFFKEGLRMLVINTFQKAHHPIDVTNRQVCQFGAVLFNTGRLTDLHSLDALIGTMRLAFRNEVNSGRLGWRRGHNALQHKRNH